jgi:hypothetical protein
MHKLLIVVLLPSQAGWCKLSLNRRAQQQFL